MYSSLRTFGTGGSAGTDGAYQIHGNSDTVARFRTDSEIPTAVSGQPSSDAALAENRIMHDVGFVQCEIFVLYEA